MYLYTGNCSAGYYCNDTSDRPDQHDCPQGHYCPVGTAVPVPCPAGTMSSATKISDEAQCANCTAGAYCQGTEISYDMIIIPI